MHTIEFSNGNDSVYVVIESATRERLTLKIGESWIVTSVTAYLSFAEAFAEAFHALRGTATLRDIDGNEVIDVIFSHRGVRIAFHDPLPEKTLQTDQSYMTEPMRQIGIWNRL
ncbi:hypothetical protein PJK55_11195 [Exiguobacterium sp. MMG028]|uniref:hypothetical protein n=1 Tax=Exiguobacterium sp. MMG028 TaxID=3021979 RepID=UPI0022FDE05B|nr:hypothetical protein [Exiguobacterium sp. MMG028]MDA5561303.1 hypothetical protein [Exiguobacterium sp. MMG028]